MGDVDTKNAILRAVPAFAKAAAAMRKAAQPGGDLAQLLSLMGERAFDRDDWDLFKALLAGELNPGRGNRGKGHNALPAAEREARALAKERKITLPAAAERVAKKHRMQPVTLANELRRSRRRRG